MDKLRWVDPGDPEWVIVYNCNLNYNSIDKALNKADKDQLPLLIERCNIWLEYIEAQRKRYSASDFEILARLFSNLRDDIKSMMI